MASSFEHLLYIQKKLRLVTEPHDIEIFDLETANRTCMVLKIKSGSCKSSATWKEKKQKGK